MVSHSSFIASSSRHDTGLGVALVFCATIFVSASLLFSVQPIFTKMTLPILGGSANVWNTAMVFFQAMLLGGYIYAWAISRFLRFKIQVVTHLVVTGLGVLFLPMAVSQSWVQPDGAMPTFWLLGLYGASIGIPFFALSANAPLLQRWFSYTSHKDSEDPYFLYAVSNAGSLIVLLSYPLVVEPNLRIQDQSNMWSAGYLVLWLSLVLTAVAVVWRRGAEVSDTRDVSFSVPVRLGTVAYWVALAFVPSSLMLGVTTYLSTNVASMPFLWIVPLSLYLLSFIIAFSGRRTLSSERLGRVLPFAVIAALLALFPIAPILVRFVIEVLAFFVIATYAHTRLADARPQADKLTVFYIFMSLGGVLGGAFNALLAPVMFDIVVEFPMMLALSGGLILTREHIVSIRVNATPVKITLIGVGIVFAIASTFMTSLINCPILVALVALYLGLRWLAVPPAVIATTLATAGYIGAMASPFAEAVVMRDRSFFSTLRVEAREVNGMSVHVFIHGNTMHNMQLRDAVNAHIPLSYYNDGNTFDVALRAAREGRREFDALVIGLGAGALACQAEPNENWTYMEIDPKVVDLALDPDYFSYMSLCAPSADIRLGDARITLKEVPDASQDIILVDAFTSNVIPSHLLTREAIRSYANKLKTGGVVFVHTSNRLLDITSVVVSTANAEGLSTVFLHTSTGDFEGDPLAEFYSKSEGVLIGQTERIDELIERHGWPKAVPNDNVSPWTDDYASIIEPLIAKRKAGTHKEATP